MIIDQELIERYHRNQCTAQEAAAVEDWLFAESAGGETVSLPEGENKADHKAAMWNAIATHMHVHAAEGKVQRKKTYKPSVLSMSMAASLLLFMVGSYFYLYQTMDQSSAIAAQDHSSFSNTNIKSNGLHILLGDKSKANINPSSDEALGNVDFCGMILIDPEKDMTLTLNAHCVSPSEDSKIQNLKKGQRYIAFNYKFNSANEVILINERNLTNLPPVLQREIMKQFHIL